MTIRFPEHQLGKGTLGYRGETREYYDSKRGLWDVTRWVVAGVLLVVGLGFLWASTAPVVSATVVSVTERPLTGTNLVVVRTPDDVVGALTLPLVETPGVGEPLAVRELPLGRLAPEDGSGDGRSAAVLFLVAGTGMVLFNAWRVRRPKAHATTVLAPDDAYELRPRS